jgi:hypothetical protein
MPEFAYMIDEQYLKDNSPIDDNVDSKTIATAMRTAQDIYIRDLIGSGIYDEILTQINAGTLAADTENTTLVNYYIAPCLVHYIITEATIPMTFKFMNKSISTRSSDNTQPVDIDMMTKIINEYKDKAEYYANRLTDYLRANSTDYPLYLNPGSDQTTIHPRSGQFFGGIFFDDNFECNEEN